MTPGKRIVVRTTLLGPLLGGVIFVAHALFLLNIAGAARQSAQPQKPHKLEGCVKLPNEDLSQCDNQGKFEFHDARIWERVKEKRNETNNSKQALGQTKSFAMIAFFAVIGSYIFGLIPAFLASLYPAYCASKHTKLNVPLYFVFAAGSSILFTVILSHLSWHSNALNFGLVTGVIALIVAAIFYLAFIKKTIHHSLVTPIGAA